MLSPTSPNNTALVQGQGIGDLADFVFANPTSMPVSVTGATFKSHRRLERLSYQQCLPLPRGEAASLTRQASRAPVLVLELRLASSRSQLALGNDLGPRRHRCLRQVSTIGASLVSVSSNGTLDSSVPSRSIRWLPDGIAAATLATVDFAANSAYYPDAATTISPQSAYPIWQNTVTVSTNPVKLMSMKFTNLGSIDSSVREECTPLRRRHPDRPDARDAWC
jgi:hypothetical protein